MMYLFNFVRVYESLNDAQSNPDKIPLVMDTSDINPGFTKLKLVNKLYIHCPMIHVCGETVGEETYISSKRFRERHLPKNMVIHGPCHSTAGGEYDGVICLRINEWITPAQQWIHRSQYNLFEDRFTEEEHKTLMDTLKTINGSPWTSIFDTSTFQTYILDSANWNSMVLSVSELPCLTYIQRVAYTSPSNSTLFKRLMNGNDRIFKRKMDAFMLSLYSGASMQSLNFYNLTDGNNSFYKQYKNTLFYFKISLQSDSVSSWLLLASLFYNCKRYLECLEIIHFCLSRFTLDKIYIHVANNLTEQTIFKKMKQRFGLLITFKYLIIGFLNFKNPFGLLPNELKSLIRGNRIDFPPVVYSYVLSCLCYHHMRDYRKKLNALSDLELTVKERYFVFPSAILLKTAKECLDIAKALT
ncbi:unnamed protein product [Mytilus coruscus]|uniref:Uncharacterized protein n=1 Tax=Mytilus coruscus TaxID=42192 RepID=A0A6J8EFX8_MYTCO|nr:unnamed protein product [Mytilus coruscus]